MTDASGEDQGFFHSPSTVVVCQFNNLDGGPGRRGTTGRVFARPEVLFHLGLGAHLYEELLKQLMRESKPGVG